MGVLNKGLSQYPENMRFKVRLEGRERETAKSVLGNIVWGRKTSHTNCLGEKSTMNYSNLNREGTSWWSSG